MRWTRSHDRAMLVFIFCSCCMSLNVLFTKIRRILEIKELERTSERDAEIVSLIYYSSSIAEGEASLYLLIQSEDGKFPSGAVCESRNGSSHHTNELKTVPLGASNVLIGVCETAAEPLDVSIHLDDFKVNIEPLSLSREHEDVVCLGYAFLFEDRNTLRTLLEYYSQRSDLMVLYVGSMSDDVFEETESYKEKLEIIPWPLFPRKSKDSPDNLHLSARSHRVTQAAAFADCWLRFAPISQRITMSDLAAIKFPAAKTDRSTGDSIFKHLYSSWAIAQLLTHRIIRNEYEDITIAERCYAREQVFGWRSDCQNMAPGAKNYTSVEQISLKKINPIPAVPSAYANDIQRCLSHKPLSEEKRTVMKLEFDLDKARRGLDPCDLSLKRENMKCRVAVDYTSMMFRERLKISVVKKRSLLSFSHGCHL